MTLSTAYLPYSSVSSNHWKEPGSTSLIYLAHLSTVNCHQGTGGEGGIVHVADGLRLPKLLCCENNTQIRPITVSFSGSVIDKLEQKMNVLWKLFISLKRSLKDALCCVLKFLKHY